MVVVTWRGAAWIGDCLDALTAQERVHQVLVVDNASDDGTAAVLAAHPSAPEVLRLPRNTGYAGGLAAALARVRTPLMAWLNDDALPHRGWLAAMEDALDADPTGDVAAVTAALRRPGGEVQSLGVALTSDGHGRDIVVEGREPFGFCGGAALLRVDALRVAGGVPARFFCYYEDTDTAWRLRLARRRVVHAAGAQVVHQHGASSGLDSTRFHHWNERNRLSMLVRCAPATVAAREMARFAALTLLLPVRADVPEGPNFRFGLRAGALAAVLVSLPRLLTQRRDIGRRASTRRADVWRTWAS